jgi:hypothetical protein
MQAYSFEILKYFAAKFFDESIRKNVEYKSGFRYIFVLTNWKFRGIP